MFTAEKRGTILDMTCIHERPVEVGGRIISGDWEGDLIVGKGHKSVIGSDVERSTRTFLYVALKQKDVTSVRKAFARAMKSLPIQMRQSLTYERGKEITKRKLFTKKTG